MQLYRRSFNLFRFLLKPKHSRFDVPRCAFNLNQRLLINKYNAGLLVFSLGWLSQAPSEPSEEELRKRKAKEIIKTADDLYKQNKYREVFQLLAEHKDSSDVEILWRLARAQYNLSQESSTSAEEKKSLITSGYAIITRSLELNDKCFQNHKWMSILLDARSSYDGIAARITHLEAVKQHMEKAVELNPKDATTLYMLGLWCYQIADMPWYQRKLASTIFATPPTSTYEEALAFFIKAEEAEPRFYSQNLLMLGKTYLRLNKEDKAKYYLYLAYNYPVSTDEDHMASKEAYKLLQQFKTSATPEVA